MIALKFNFKRSKIHVFLKNEFILSKERRMLQNVVK